MAIFNSYVSLPEGIPNFPKQTSQKVRQLPPWCQDLVVLKNLTIKGKLSFDDSALLIYLCSTLGLQGGARGAPLQVMSVDVC